MITITGSPEPAVRPAPEMPAFRRCGGCGTAERPASTVVIDWTVEILCDECVASHDWTGWIFDPLTNTYARR